MHVVVYDSLGVEDYIQLARSLMLTPSSLKKLLVLFGIVPRDPNQRTLTVNSLSPKSKQMMEALTGAVAERKAKWIGAADRARSGNIFRMWRGGDVRAMGT
ncbi:unnamed protein product [Nezara viridula]|uniref:Uncharacterized protein n=1 Tax=Nezara viridula TaxID=85310 RepID=A0A9P0HTU6_NEZVI|nr:unnamed protein product [Nezara viridula]